MEVVVGQRVVMMLGYVRHELVEYAVTSGLWPHVEQGCLMCLIDKAPDAVVLCRSAVGCWQFCSCV